MTSTHPQPLDRPDVDGPDAIERMIELARPERVTGADRKVLAKFVGDRYAGGATLGQLAEQIKRSTGLVRKLVEEAGVAIRTGGPRATAEESETTEPTVWVGPPEPMARVQPDDLDWSWRDIAAYHAELVVELYVQGRSYEEVAAVTGYPADDVRAMALAAGVARPHRVQTVVSAWRSRARAKLRGLHGPGLLRAWVEGVEVEDLAEGLNVPADLLWDLIAAELARTNQRKELRERAWGSVCRVPCAGICLYGCAHACAETTLTPTDAQPSDWATSTEHALPERSWPPRAELGDQITVNDDGTVSWKWFGTPAD